MKKIKVSKTRPRRNNYGVAIPFVLENDRPHNSSDDLIGKIMSRNISTGVVCHLVFLLPIALRQEKKLTL